MSSRTILVVDDYGDLRRLVASFSARSWLSSPTNLNRQSGRPNHHLA